MNRKILLASLLGFVIGVVWLVGLRFVTYESKTVHYHASFNLYINGQQDKFDNFTFYEEVQSCTDEELNNPRSRVHLHNNVGWIIHIHDKAATWGHFFSNLGYGLNDELITTDGGTYIDGADGNKLTFWLNGEPAESIANRTIGDEDRLLINYGSEDTAALRSRFEAVPSDAHDYNEKTDPATCSGSAATTGWDRLKLAIGLAN